MEWLSTISVVLGVIISAASVITLIKTRTMGKLSSYIRKESCVEKNKETDEELHKKIDDLTQTLHDYMKEERQDREKTHEMMRAQHDASRQLLANIIETTYYADRARKALTMNEFKRVVNAFSIYHNEFEGNSYIAELYNEMMEWEKS